MVDVPPFLTVQYLKPALSCRVKRIEQVGDLESEKTDEQRDMDKMAQDNTSMRLEIDKVYQDYEALKNFAYQHSIPLPAELETL